MYTLCLMFASCAVCAELDAEKKVAAQVGGSNCAEPGARSVQSSARSIQTHGRADTGTTVAYEEKFCRRQRRRKVWNDQCTWDNMIFVFPFSSLFNSNIFFRHFANDNEIRTMDLLMETREQNKCLRLQVETLRQKLGDAQADIKVLRTSNHGNIDHREVQLAPDVHQREEMIEQLERLNVKVCLLYSVTNLSLRMLYVIILGISTWGHSTIECPLSRYGQWISLASINILR